MPSCRGLEESTISTSYMLWNCALNIMYCLASSIFFRRNMDLIVKAYPRIQYA